MVTSTTSTTSHFIGRGVVGYSDPKMYQPLVVIVDNIIPRLYFGPKYPWVLDSSGVGPPESEGSKCPLKVYRPGLQLWRKNPLHMSEQILFFFKRAIYAAILSLDESYLTSTYSH